MIRVLFSTMIFANELHRATCPSLLSFSKIVRDGTRIIVERNNAGVALSQALQARGIEVIEHYTHTPTAGQPTKTSGKADDIINYIEKGLKTGIVVFPSNSEDNMTMDMLEKLKNEHTNFGVKQSKNGERYEALAGKDDLFDSAWVAFKHRNIENETLDFAVTVSG